MTQDTLQTQKQKQLQTLRTRTTEVFVEPLPAELVECGDTLRLRECEAARYSEVRTFRDQFGYPKFCERRDVGPYQSLKRSRHEWHAGPSWLTQYVRRVAQLCPTIDELLLLDVVDPALLGCTCQRLLSPSQAAFRQREHEKIINHLHNKEKERGSGK